MSDKLPERIDPVLFAERRSMLSGAIDIAAFERLSDLVFVNDGVVLVDVGFAKQGKRAVITGTIQGCLQLVCQSCLAALPWPLNVSFKLGVVASGQEVENLEIDCEPLLLDEDTVSLVELIEDEILLTLPDYPKHDWDCIPVSSSKDADFDKNAQIQTNNPFSVLAKLKKTGE